MKRHESRHTASVAQALTAETIGTFVLTFVAVGADFVAAVTGRDGESARVVAPALAVAAMIYALGEVSGAHINPAVTLAFAARRAFAWRKVPAYWCAQLAGALGAVVALRALFGPAGNQGVPAPHHGVAESFAFEAILTTFLVLVILGTASHHQLLGPNAAIAVGVTIAFCGLLGAHVSGASMNPARSLGPALVAGRLNDAWLYICAPFLGALVATALTYALEGAPTPQEHKAAGDD